MADALISMRDINKYYAMGEEQAHILKDVNLSVASGEYLSILGPSGSGKSTLMNIIGCLDTPTSGSYLLNGEAVEELSQVELAGIRSRIDEEAIPAPLRGAPIVLIAAALMSIAFMGFADLSF